MGTSADQIEEWIEEGTLAFTLGDSAEAERLLLLAAEADPNSFGAWHALAEVHYAEGRYDQAREAAERAHKILPEDIHINTSLSRIWLELGSKEEAEKFGAEARRLSWKEALKEGPDSSELR